MALPPASSPPSGMGDAGAALLAAVTPRRHWRSMAGADDDGDREGDEDGDMEGDSGGGVHHDLGSDGEDEGEWITPGCGLPPGC